MECKNRIMKVQNKSVPRETHYKNVPWLNLHGVWLEKAGFEIGDHIQIVVQNNSLVIQVIDKATKEKPY